MGFMISKVKGAVLQKTEHWPDWLLLLVSIFLLSVVSFFALTFWELRAAAQAQEWGGNMISTLSHFIQIVGCCMIGSYVGKRRAGQGRPLSMPLLVGAAAGAAVLLFYCLSLDAQVMLSELIFPSHLGDLYNVSLLRQFLIEKVEEPPNAIALLGCEVFYFARSMAPLLKQLKLKKA